jgi:hypothetical protein
MLRSLQFHSEELTETESDRCTTGRKRISSVVKKMLENDYLLPDSRAMRLL